MSQICRKTSLSPGIKITKYKPQIFSENENFFWIIILVIWFSKSFRYWIEFFVRNSFKFSFWKFAGAIKPKLKHLKNQHYKSRRSSKTNLNGHNVSPSRLENKSVERIFYFLFCHSRDELNSNNSFSHAVL